jgi:endonuclease YncB( thermonuclease family)
MVWQNGQSGNPSGLGPRPYRSALRIEAAALENGGRLPKVRKGSLRDLARQARARNNTAALEHIADVETSEKSNLPTRREFCDHPLGPVEKRRAEWHRDFGKSLKRNSYRVRLASITLAAALCAGSTPCASQDGERPSVRSVSPPKVIRTYRPRIADDFFKQDAVCFERARIDKSGSILADGHNLNLYGVVLVRRDKICTGPEGARWACGQRAFIALRSLLEGKSITCRFKHVTVPPKAVCWVGDSDVTHLLLSQGWAELADEVTEASYVEALASAQSKKAGIWGDGPP